MKDWTESRLMVSYKKIIEFYIVVICCCFAALWFRISERLGAPLPFKERFQNDIWQLVKSRSCFEYFEIAKDRETPKRMDRRDFYFKTDIADNDMMNHIKSSYYIYSYHPVDDPIIRGSCEEFKTRKKINQAILKEMNVDEVTKKFGRRLVIVANQDKRNSVLIPKNLGRECDINNAAYCILERIGRARHFGEATSGTFSLLDYVKDSKLLHYFRNTLLKNLLVIRQQMHFKIRTQTISCQLFHLPRFHVIIRATNMLQSEQLFDHLKKKPNHIVELEEAKQFLGLNQKPFLTFIRSRANIFKYELKVPYRNCHPEAKPEIYLMKNKAEKTVTAISLVDPNFDIYKLWNLEDDDIHEDEEGFLDTSKQKINRPLVYQICEKIEEAGKIGMSQNEIGKYFGLSRLNARSVLRKVQRERNISFYMKDEGRQRVSK